MRVVAVLVGGLVALTANSLAFAQSTSPVAAAGAPSLAAQEQRIQSLESSVASLRGELGQLNQNLTDLLNRLPAQPLPDKHVTQRELDQVVSELKGDMKAMQILLGQQQDETNRLLESIAYNKNGIVGLNLRSMMNNNQNFRDEMRDVVRDSLPVPPTYGWIIVKNRMYSGVWMRVNQESRYISPGAEEYFRVPVGTATAQLLGYESPKNWFVGAPTYSQRIIIGYGNP